MHLIRIHGPWTAEIDRDGQHESRRVHLPRDWDELGRLARTGSVSLLRRFHRPTGLSTTTRVAISVPKEWPLDEVTLNGQRLAPSAPTNDRQLFDISAAVRDRESHDLEMRFSMGVDLASHAYSVALEILEPDVPVN
ncbi:hypothetical protein Pan44_21070 [Caulifigura coniformis]|uniref:Uncharacterized protein n=1 Tax=Caulifigura coniformis TaxID=2527983 RepID=A0A517SD82_9PLAN|nr:hypothetical protein [Caulifigura coniformis]QDT54080.1 hypothetical protein Pan44_21070 [Caulifigura coniformis]